MIVAAIGKFDPPFVLTRRGVEKCAGGGDWDKCVLAAMALPHRAVVPLDSDQIVVPVAHDPLYGEPRILLRGD